MNERHDRRAMRRLSTLLRKVSIHGGARLNNLASQNQGSANQKLWQAVISSALADWVRGPACHKEKAEYFLFHDQEDFPFVCRSAGLNPESVRESLWMIRAQAAVDTKQNAA
jgi:hypothetical protein